MQASSATSPLGRAASQARYRLLVCAAGSLVVVWLDSPAALIWLAAWAALLALTSTPPGLLLKAYALAAGLLLLSLGFGLLLAQWSPALRGAGWGALLTPFLRVAVLISLTLAVALGSKPSELLAALKGMRLPLFIYLPLLVMIRLVPSLISDLRQIADSLRLKGVRLNPFSLVFSPVKTTRLLCAPLVFRVLRSAEELAVAAELKGLGGAARLTAWPSPGPGWREASLLGLSALAVAGALWLQGGMSFLGVW